VGNDDVLGEGYNVQSVDVRPTNAAGDVAAATRARIDIEVVRNAPPGRFSGEFAMGCKVARVKNPDCNVPPNGYNLYTCAVLFDDCTRVLVYTAWYLDTSTTAVLSAVPLDMCTTAVLSTVQLYGEVHQARNTCCTRPGDASQTGVNLGL
jgi:hypothetical protein